MAGTACHDTAAACHDTAINSMCARRAALARGPRRFT
jgi:hypothetical protein